LSDAGVQVLAIGFFSSALQQPDRMNSNIAKQKIGHFLAQTIGLDISTVSDSTLTQAIGHRMEKCALTDLRAYFSRLTTSKKELRCLTEEVVVPETWFFRHKKSFDIFVQQVLQAQQNNPDFFLRILSLPCSSGEEPYSIVMALLDAGIDLDRIYLKAVDISERALVQARRGVYGKNSFRSENLAFRDKYFSRVDKKFVLRDVVRSKVYFAQGNLAEPSFSSTLGLFDVIFCRNILIYFGERMQQQVINSLYDLLMPGGTLFAGHAEANLFLDSRFRRSSHPDSFAFHKEEMESMAWNSAGRIIVEDEKVPERCLAVGKTAVDFTERQDALETDPGEVSFDAVLLLADGGRLEEAVDACEQHLRMHGPSSRWYYLLGVIQDSLGQVENAVAFLRKALYLDPKHEESLFLLSLLAEQTGEHAQAEQYRRRARKVREKEGKYDSLPVNGN